MNNLINVYQDLINGYVCATMISRGIKRKIILVTSLFEPADIHYLKDCQGVSDIDLDEDNGKLSFHVKPSDENEEIYMEFSRIYF